MLEGAADDVILAVKISPDQVLHGSRSGFHSDKTIIRSAQCLMRDERNMRPSAAARSS